MKLTLLGLSVALAAALTACGGTDQNTSISGGTGGSGASTNTGAGGSGGDPTGGTSTGGSTGGGNTGGDPTGGTGGTIPGGGPCGGLAGMPCNADQYCDYPTGNCGADDSTGTCVDKPAECSDIYDPICGCDGQVHSNPCDAAQGGVDGSLLGGCTPPDGLFPCGASFCAADSEFCQVQVSDIADEPNVYSCNPLPPNCQVEGATCGCLADLPCGNMCEQADGGFTLTCPGG